MWMIPPLIYLFVWMTAAGTSEIGGFTRGKFVSYYLVLIVVNQITYSQTNWTVGDQIRAGTMNIHLLRPISPMFDALASEIAGKVVYLIFTIPITLILGLVLRPELDVTLKECILFGLALGLAWALRFIWGYWIAILAFWATRADALLTVQDSLIFLLAGQVAPVNLLPGLLKNASIVLPFRYMIGFPVEVLTGQLSAADILQGFVIQVSWLLATFVLFRFLWYLGMKQYSAVGG
jgi:ABC-2 type transport system permease protein